MAHSSRRRFFEQTIGAASLAALAGARAARAAAPNERLGVAVVGVHGQGGSHISQFVADPRCEIRYIVDVDRAVGEGRAAEIEAATGKRPAVVQDMRLAFADPAVDCVSTATPNHWHALVAVWAMQAGKHVYVEKPLAWCIAEGRAVVEAARKYERLCQVGTQCRSHRAIREAMQFLHEGGIGEVRFARGLCYKRRKSIGALGDYTSQIPGSVDFGLWSGPAPFTTPRLTRPSLHYDWHWQRHYGNGDLGNQGPHQTDIARWGLGLDRHPNRVLAYGGRLGYQAERGDPAYVDAGDVANTEVSVYDYGDKCLVFETRGLETPDLRGAKIGVIFEGTEGSLVHTSYTSCTAYDKAGNKTREFSGGGAHVANFVDAIVSGKREDLNGESLEGHLSASLSHLGNISYYLGSPASVAEIRDALGAMPSLDDNAATLDRTIEHLSANGVDLGATPLTLGSALSFDPNSERFAGAPEADALLTREYRDGFVCPSASAV